MSRSPKVTNIPDGLVEEMWASGEAYLQAKGLIEKMGTMLGTESRNDTQRLESGNRFGEAEIEEYLTDYFGRINRTD